MTKQSGLGDEVYFNGVAIGDDVGALQNISCPQETLDVTGITKSAFERIGGRRDGAITFTNHFDPTGAHATLATLPTTNRIVTYCRGLALGKPAASLVGFQIGYDGTRDASGGLSFSVAAQGNGYGLDWGEGFGLITDTGAASSDPIDGGAGGTTAFGFQAFLHVIAFDGTDCTLTLEQSTDNGVGDAFASLEAFTEVTAVGAERIAATGNVERYVRVTTSGTFTSITYFVSFTRNLVAVTF